MKILNRLLHILTYLLPAVLFFSYYPVIRLGGNASMNFELSLALIWLVLYAAIAFCWLIATYLQGRRAQSRSSKSRATTSLSSRFWGKSLTGLSDRRFFLFALFPLYLTISIFWSSNPLRGLLTAGVMWLVFFAVFTIIYILPLTTPPAQFRRRILASFLISSAAVCLFCFLQSILDLLGLGREHTLMCLGCTYRSFGFPHPSGFAIEPQFMGNLLLAPTLTTLYLLTMQNRNATREDQPHQPASQSKATSALSSQQQAATPKRARRRDVRPDQPSPRQSTWPLVALAMLFSTTLFFTFSRGAIYAYAVALLVMIIISAKRHHFRWSLLTIPVISFLISLGLQGTFSALSPTPEIFVSGVTKSIHQLSLGLIDLRPQDTSPVTNPVPTVENSDKPVDKSSENVENSPQKVENYPENSGNPAQNSPKPGENSASSSSSSISSAPEISVNSSSSSNSTSPDPTPAGNQTHFDGYVAESTNIRLGLNRTALDTWLSAPGHPHTSVNIGCARWSSDDPATCLAHAQLTPTSILFGVGLGAAGTAMHAAYPAAVTSPKEIVQNEFFSLLLETGLVGILLALFSLLVAFAPRLFSAKFLDGRAASVETAPSSFWRHPGLPLLLPLIIAYLVTLNFFSGLPNALQIYLLPPLLYLIFLNSSKKS